MVKLFLDKYIFIFSLGNKFVMFCIKRDKKRQQSRRRLKERV
jgi:hypothetical protein